MPFGEPPLECQLVSTMISSYVPPMNQESWRVAGENSCQTLSTQCVQTAPFDECSELCYHLVTLQGGSGTVKTYKCQITWMCPPYGHPPKVLGMGPPYGHPLGSRLQGVMDEPTGGHPLLLHIFARDVFYPPYGHPPSSFNLFRRCKVIGMCPPYGHPIF